MKIRTKFLAAVLAVATALSCALTASATPPQFTLDNSASPATVNGTNVSGTLTLKATDFADVTGAQLKVTFPYTLDFAEITDSNWVKNQDYKVDGNTVELVNVFNIDTTDKNLILNLYFKFSVETMPETLSVTVSGGYSDKQVNKVYDIYSSNLTLKTGKVTANGGDKAAAAEAIKTAVKDSRYFIPEGGVYTVGENDAITYYPKTGVDTFDIADNANNVEFIKCPLPTAGEVTTFGASKSTIDDANSENSIQFGSYIDNITDSNSRFGTLIIAAYDLSDTLVKASYKKGSYENAVEYFKEKNSNADNPEKLLFQSIIAAFSKKDGWTDGKLHPYTYGKTKEVIYAAVVPRTKYMWKNTETNYTKLQYAVRCIGLKAPDLQSKYYTAVGYTVVGGTYKFSNEIQTASYNSLS